jgi:tetratricopeptide (TPR) repeat protein
VSTDETTRRWERASKAELAGDGLLRAFRELLAALRSDPRDPEPKRLLHKLAGQHDAWEELATFLGDEARAAADPTVAAAILRELAEVRLRQGRTVDAELAFLKILSMIPDASQVRDGLERIYRSQKRWRELAASLELRTDPRLGTSGELAPEDEDEGLAPESRRSALLYQLADIYEKRLDLPREAAATLEKMRALTPDDPGVYERLAPLYGRIGSWANAAQALTFLAELTEDDDRGREALREAVTIYRDQCGLPERAVDAARKLVRRWPDDMPGYEALRVLLERQEQWGELAEVCGALAALAVEDHDRARHLGGRAHALDRVGRLGDALVAVEEAVELAPDDGPLEDLRIDLLARTGKPGLAAALLEARLAVDDSPSIRLRLAEVLVETDDRERARELAEQTLAARPGDQTALAILTRLARGSSDPRIYPAARLREAAALPAGPAKIAALLDAARRLRDRVRDLPAAVEVFEEALALAPDAEVERELTDLRATLHIDGALAEEQAGDPVAAEKQLRQALMARPDDVGAYLALARVMLNSDRGADAVKVLRKAQAAFAEAAPEIQGRITMRLAQVVEALGDTDEANRLLLEADRQKRNDLDIKLALGESCIRRGLWHEAALHLGMIAQIPGVASRGPEAARGLLRGAQAELRAKRPEKAAALYEAAVRLDPRCTPALHALAEIAMERDDLPTALDLLEREAAATPEARDRLRLYDALGDMAASVLHDDVAAERLYAEAVRHAGTLEMRHIPLLDKLHEAQRRRPGVGLGDTCERLAELHEDAAIRRDLLIEAVDAFVAGGDRARARAAAARVADAEPLDAEAVWRASQLELDDGEHEAAAARLGRLLEAPSAIRSSELGPRVAQLWRRIGDARRMRDDAAAALPAYEAAIAASPDSDGALAARRGMLMLGADTPLDRATAMVQLRRLLDAEPHAAEALALARALASDLDPGAVHEARALFELASALGAEPSESDQAFLAANPARVMASDESYGVTLDEAERAIVGDPDDAPLADILDACWEAAPFLVPDAKTALEQAGFAGADRLSPVSPTAVAAMFPQIVKVLGGPTILAFVTRDSQAPDLAVLCASPPVVVFGPEVVSRRARSQSDAAATVAELELRFRLARVVELARPRRVFAAGMPPAAFAHFVAGLWRAFGRATSSMPPDSVADGVAERLRKSLPLTLRSRLEQRLRDAPREALDAARYQEACARAADRAGLIVCGHAGVAIAAAGGAGAAPHLVATAASAAYLALRRRMR